MRLAPITLALVAACGGGSTTPDGAPAPGKRVLIQNKGSDTLVNVAQAWAEAYKTVNPDVAVAVSGGGSGTGISAVINGTADIANSSRKLKEQEIAAARKNGTEPVEFLVGYDALAVFLHPDNPIAELSVDQLKQIYAEGGTYETWSDVGVTVPGCPSDEIVRVSRQNNSGTYVYFKEAVLGEGAEFKLGSRDMHGSKDVVDLVEKTPCAIGYSGLAYATSHVKMPCVKQTADAACVAPSLVTAKDGTYPVARPLLMYTRGQPEGAVKAYLEWILSDAGQCIIHEAGYATATDATCG